MSILGRTNPTATLRPSGEYLDALVDAKEAAHLLGVSAGRWRQITGSRDTPNPELGPTTIEPGRRGARWQLRSVLQYAMAHDYSTTSPLPPLLPGTGARYEPVSGRVWNAPAARELPLAGQGRTARVWAQMFAPSTYRRCGYDEQGVLLVTPLWPAGWTSISADLWSIVAAALEVPGWRAILGQPAALTVVTIPGGDGGVSSTGDPQRIPVHQVGPDEIARLDHLAGITGIHHPIDYWVPASDVASCLGWSALPWWPHGTASRSTCALWEPGTPVSITSPASMAGRAEATAWLTHSAEPTGQASRDDIRALTRDVAPGRLERNESSWSQTPPSGFEVAVDISWPPIPDATPADAEPSRALDSILASPTVPPVVARTLFDWFGDPTYTRPLHLRFDELPVRWAELLRGLAKDAEPGDEAWTPRWRALEDARQEASPTDPTAVHRILIGPLHAPALIDDETITWLAPTGYTPEDANDRPSRAVPADTPPHELMLSRDILHSHPCGWLRTATDEVMPLPGRGQVVTNDYEYALVLRAAVLNTSVQDLADADRKQEVEAIKKQEPATPTDVERLITSLPPEPVTHDWTSLERMATTGMSPVTDDIDAPHDPHTNGR